MREYLKEMRVKKGMTQMDVANILDVSESYYNMIENGERKKSLDMNTAMKLAEIFNVSLEFICEQESKLEKVIQQ